MRRAALLGLLALASCGEPPASPSPPALEREALESTPTGPAREAGRGLAPGAWRAEVLVAVRVEKGGRVERESRARLGIRQTVTDAPDGLESEVEFRVVEAEGQEPTRGRFEAWDGLRARVPHAATGRPDLEALRWTVAPPPGSEELLLRFWLGGFGASRPWVPAGPLRQGEAWDLAALTPAEAEASAGRRREGGGRLEASWEEGGTTWWRVRLEFVESATGAEGGRQATARTRGEAVLDAATGLPRSWEVEEVLRQQVDGTSWAEVRLTVRGRVEAGGDGDADGHVPVPR